MTRWRRPFAPVLMWCMVAAAAPASAQVATSLVSPASVVHEYVSAASGTAGRADIPSNMEVTDIYRGLLIRMLSRSPTFRRQMLRISAASRLTVRLQSPFTSSPQGLRATTVFERKVDGQLVANIDIAWSTSPVELIAHEIEHVIEQLDGVDLAAKLRRPDSGVFVTGEGGNVFETTRAKRVGLQVAREVQ